MQGLLKNWLLLWLGADAVRMGREARRRRRKVNLKPIILFLPSLAAVWHQFIYRELFLDAEFKHNWQNSVMFLLITRPIRPGYRHSTFL